MNIKHINLLDWPSMPAPMHSKDAGAAWVWGDFFTVLQKEPMSVAQLMQAMAGKPVTRSPMDYPYAMTVYRKVTKGEHVSPGCPVLCVAIEQVNAAGVNATFGDKLDGVVNTNREAAMPMMVGLFTGSHRFNLGTYDGAATADSAWDLFAGIVRERLGLSGDPQSIGPISAVFGHPETGWPAKSEE